MKKQGYILDTGSSITTSPCQPLCEHCGKHLNSYYKINDIKDIIQCKSKKCKMVSSSCNKEKCSFSTSYSEGSSLSGVYINEIVRFGQDYKKKKGKIIPIGCTTNENHLFYTQDADGIMGLCNNEHNFINILFLSKAISHNIFSLCFARLGGYFSIGEINYKYHKEKVHYFPIRLDNNKYYGIHVNEISVNKEKLQAYNQNQYTFFLDSGTTISYFDNELYNQIISITKKNCNENGNKCGKIYYDNNLGPCFNFKNHEELLSAINYYWPTITFHMKEYDFKWSPDKYFFNNTSNDTISGCMGFNKRSSKRITLGGTWFIGHDIIFDNENNRIGIAESECYQNKNINLINGLESNKIQNNKNLKNEEFLDMSIIETSNIYVIVGLFLFFSLFCSFIALFKYYQLYKLRIKKGREIKIVNYTINSNYNNTTNIMNNNMIDIKNIPNLKYETIPLNK